MIDAIEAAVPWWKEVRPEAAIPMVVAVVAACASVYSARISWKSSRTANVRELLQRKIESLTSAVTTIQRLDEMEPYLSLGESLGAKNTMPFVAASSLFKSIGRFQADMCCAVIPVGHYLAPTRQIAVGDLLSFGNRIHTAIINQILSDGNSVSLQGMAPYMESLRSMKIDISFQLQEELDNAVAALMTNAGLRSPKPVPRHRLD